MSFERLIAVWGVATCWLYAGCIDVTCEERGTCAPGSSNETSSENTSSSSGGSSSRPAGDEAGVSETSSAVGDAQASTGSGNVGDADTECAACLCEAGSCEDSGPLLECSETQAATCSAPEGVCILEDGLASCVECARDAHCSAATPTCVERACQVCDLATHRGCAEATPFCVEVAPVGLDAGGDGGTFTPLLVDAAADAATDATPLPLTDGGQLDRTCVECRDADDCGQDAPFCTGGTCVQCLDDGDCTDPAASQCDPATLSCVGCAATGECSHLTNTPACDITSNMCVECTAAERGACGDNACTTIANGDQFTCSTQALLSADSCESCVSDAACDVGFGCVLEIFDGTPTEWVCLPRKGDGTGEVDDCTTRPLVGSVEAQSADADEEAEYCRPRRTTCSGLLSYGTNGPSGDPGSDWCTSDADCGLPGVNDGSCLPFNGNEDTKLCTYPCQVSVDCQDSVSCGTSTGSGSTTVCSLD